MKSTDQLGRIHVFDQTPVRIVSLVPSLTEMLCDMGLRDNIAGCTKFCVHPVGLKKEVQIIGGTKNVNFELVKSLQPDIIIANKEENDQPTIEALDKSCKVWVSDISDINDSLHMIQQMGQIFQVSEASEQIISELESEIEKMPRMEGKIAYLIWKNPYMTVGGDTYIHHMIERLGLTNAFENEKRYPEIDINALKGKQLDVLLLSSEPFPFQQKHIDELSIILPDTKVILVDGEYFSWYGTRLIHLTGYTDRIKKQIYSSTLEA